MAKKLPVRSLISKSRRLWDRYYNRPTKLNFHAYRKHRQVMEEQDARYPSKMLKKELRNSKAVFLEGMQEHAPRGPRRTGRTGRPRIPNPTVPKFERIEKESAGLPDILRNAVMADIATAWLQAMGMDNLVFGTRESIRNDSPAHMVIGRIISAGDLPASSRYDAYLPWLGKVFRKRAKKALKVARGLPQGEIPRPPPAALASWIYFGNEDDNDDWSQLPSWERSEPIYRFRAIVDWAGSEGIDLNPLSLESILEQAELFGEKQAAEKGISQGDVVYEFDDGWTVQHLTTQEQLADEGDIMQNCIGDESIGCYTMQGIQESGVKIYSLRDPKGMPHVSMAFDGIAMEEFKGKQNSPPRNPKYIERAIEFRHHLQPGEMSGIFDDRDWRDFEPHIGTYVMSWYGEGGVAHVFREPGDGRLVADYDEFMENELRRIFVQIAEDHGLEDGPGLESEIMANHRRELNEAIEESFWDNGWGLLYKIGLPALWTLIPDGKATLMEVPDARSDEMLEQVVKILKPRP